MPELQRVTDFNRSALPPILRVSTPGGSRLRWIAHGKSGNLQTAAEMAALVRDAAMRDQGLCEFAAKLLVNAGLDSHSKTDEILDTVFRYTQRARYIADPAGSFDAISSARETLSKKPVPYGDCDDLSVLLASLLACLGFEPSFILAKYDDSTSGFDHIYVSVTDKQGNVIALDPTSRKHGIGWESPKAIEKIAFPIFGASGAFNSLAGALDAFLNPKMISQFVSTGVGLFQQSKAKSASKTAQESARWEGHEQVMSALSDIQGAIDNCQITAAQGADVARKVIQSYYSFCDQNFSGDIAKSCRNYGSESGGFDYRVQQIANRLTPGCATIAAEPLTVTQSVAEAAQAAVGSVNSAGGFGDLLSSISLPTALLILGGGFIALKAFRG